MPSCSFTEATRESALRQLLSWWIAGWPDVEAWRFEVRYDDSPNGTDCAAVCCTRLADDNKIWTARDLISMKEMLETSFNPEAYVKMRAASRYRDVMEAAAALNPENEGDL